LYFDCQIWNLYLLFLFQCRTTWVRCLPTMQQWCLTPLEPQLLSSQERVSWLSYWATIVLLAPYLLLRMSEFFLSRFSYWWEDLFSFFSKKRKRQLNLHECFDYFTLFDICSKINLKNFRFLVWMSATQNFFTGLASWNFLAFRVL